MTSFQRIEAIICKRDLLNNALFTKIDEVATCLCTCVKVLMFLTEFFFSYAICCNGVLF